MNILLFFSDSTESCDCAPSCVLDSVLLLECLSRRGQCYRVNNFSLQQHSVEPRLQHHDWAVCSGSLSPCSNTDDMTLNAL